MAINLDKLKERLEAFQKRYKESLKTTKWELNDENAFYSIYWEGFSEGYYGCEPRKYKDEYTVLQPYYDDGYADGVEAYTIDCNIESNGI